MKTACAVAMFLLLGAPGVVSAAGGEPDTLGRTKLGEFLPSPQPFTAPAVSLNDAAGNTVELANLRGKLVIVNLWATWCEPCLREMPSLERLQAQLGDRIAVLAVSEDRGGDNVVEPFIAKLGLKSVKAYIDPNSAVGHAFDVRGLPTSFLIGRDGKVLGRVEGAAEWDSPKILGVLKPLLSDNGSVKASSR
jgi:thiol-disulfide isomerase/thioredoxin